MGDKAPSINKNYFSFVLKILKWSGLGIDNFDNKVHAVLYSVYSFFVIVVCIIPYYLAQFIDLAFHITDFDYISFILCYLCTQTSGLLKIILIHFRRRSVRLYLNNLESRYFLPDMERGGITEFDLLKRAIKTCNFQAVAFCVMVTTIVANRAFAVVLNEAEFIPDIRNNITEMKISRELPYRMYFPFDTDDYYISAFTFQIYTILIFGYLIGGCDALITGVMVHLKTQMLILKNSFGNIIERADAMYQKDNNKKEFTKNNLEKVPQHVQKYVTIIVNGIIAHHQEIIKLYDDTEQEFNLVVLVQVLGSLMLMCLQLFQLSLYDITSPKFVSMLIYLMLMLFQLLLYCWNGNELTLESLEIAEAAYHCNWLYFNNDSQKALILVIQRSQRPLILTAGKFTFLSLETFVKILKGSASYYLALRSFNE